MGVYIRMQVTDVGVGPLFGLYSLASKTTCRLSDEIEAQKASQEKINLWIRNSLKPSLELLTQVCTLTP